MKNYLILLTGCFTLTSLFAGTYDLNFKSVPKTEESCHAQAKTLTELFRAQTGNATGTVTCTADNEPLANFQLSYEAPFTLPSVSTESFGVYPQGLYGSLEKCNAAIPSKTDLFVTATSLKPFINYCKPDGIDNGRFRHFILGFGESKIQYHVVGYNYFSVPKKFDTPSFVESLKKNLSSVGAIYAGVTSLGSLGYGTMGIHYYGPERINFQLVEYTKNAKEEECEEHRARLNSYPAVQENAPVISYCGHVHVGEAWELTTLFMGGEPFKRRIAAEKFGSNADCEADRERLTSFYQEQVDKKIFGGFCTRDEGRIQLLFLARK